MPSRHLLLGLDGLDLNLLRALGPEVTPQLHRLMERGAYAACESVLPAATLPNWATILTGVDPGQHGVFDFTSLERRASAPWRVRFTGGSLRQAPTFAARLDGLGQRSACLGFPGTWPPESLRHGLFVSGWDSPVAKRGKASLAWPEKRFRELDEGADALVFDDVDEFRADDPAWLARLGDALCRRMMRRLGFYLAALESDRWDAFAAYFGESDTASHYLWSCYDERSPRHVAAAASPRARQGLARVYQALDMAAGQLLAAAGGARVELTVVSDHGSGGSSDKVLFLNRVLAHAGLLRWRRRLGDGADAAAAGHVGFSAGRAAYAVRSAALRFAPSMVKEALFRVPGLDLPGRLESQVRFGDIDWQRTRAFSEELNYFPSIHLNLPALADSAVRDTAVAEVRAALAALRDPWTGRPVLKALHRREELFDGPYLERAPDLIVELELDGDYSYNLMPSSSHTPGALNRKMDGQADAKSACWRRLEGAELLGRKGRSLPGSHRSHGFFLGSGPQVKPVGEVGLGVADVHATFLARMGLAPAPEAAGSVCWAALNVDRMPGRQTVQAPRQASDPPTAPGHARAQNNRPSAHAVHLVEARLRALGYVD